MEGPSRWTAESWEIWKKIMWWFFYYNCPQTWLVEWKCLKNTDLKRFVGMGLEAVIAPLDGYKTKPYTLGPKKFCSVLLLVYYSRSNCCE